MSQQMPVCKGHLFLWIKSLWVSTCFSQRPPSRCSIHTVRGKRTGIHSVHHSADLSRSCVCVCTPACVFCELCTCVRHISSLWKQRTNIWSQTSVSVYMCACSYICLEMYACIRIELGWLLWTQVCLFGLLENFKALRGQQLNNVWERLC